MFVAPKFMMNEDETPADICTPRTVDTWARFVACTTMFLTAKYVSAANVNVIPESDVEAVTPSGRNVYDHAMAPGDVCAIVNVCWVVVSTASCVGDTSTGFTAAVTVVVVDADTPMTFVAVTVMVVGAKLVPGANENVIPLSDVDRVAGIFGEYDHATAPVYGAD